MRRKIAILDAPSNLGLRPPEPGRLPGVRRLPGALRAQRLVELLGAHDAGEVRPPPYSPDPDPRTGFRNAAGIARITQQLAERVTALIREGYFPLVLGGDCSILLGNMLGLRSLGEFGLCFIDGHQDFAYPRTNDRFGHFAAAGLDLALVTGHGPDALTNLKGRKPYVEESDVVALGFYDDPTDAADYQTEAIYQSRIQAIPVEEVRRMGAADAALACLGRLIQSRLGGFWIHLDADVLDQSVMPAVDSPNPKGLTPEELALILRTLLESGSAVGLEVTILDPELDPDGKYVAEFAHLLLATLISVEPGRPEASGAYPSLLLPRAARSFPHLEVQEDRAALPAWSDPCHTRLRLRRGHRDRVVRPAMQLMGFAEASVHVHPDHGPGPTVWKGLRGLGSRPCLTLREGQVGGTLWG